MIRLTECPRDAMQGIKTMIPTDVKVHYLNQLLAVGFDVLDFGSFVSPKAVPQMKDTAEVLSQIDLTETRTKLLAIVANEKGAIEASGYDKISILGFPFSVSEEFQQRNTRTSRQQSLDLVKKLLELSEHKNKKLLLYLSMGFGNPYGEEWSPEIVIDWAEKLFELGVRDFALSDTIGSSDPATIQSLYPKLVHQLTDAVVGMHLHTTPDSWQEKIAAAYDAGCRSFDGAIKGFGGCPMAKDDLTGNMPSEKMIDFLGEKETLKINRFQLSRSLELATSIFP